MVTQLTPSRTYRFGVYRFDSMLGRLEGPLKSAVLRPKVSGLLLALIEAAPEPLSKRELIAMVWPDTHIAATGVARVMNELRASLEEEPRAIETLPKRGYRFTLDVIAEAESPGVGAALASLPSWPDSSPSAEPAAAETIPARRTLRLLRVLALAASLILLPLALGGLPLHRASNSTPENPPVSAAEREHIVRREFQAGYRAWGLRSPVQMDIALEHFRRAGRVDPNLWFGFVGIAEAHLGRILLSAEAGPSAPKWARQAAERAVQLGPQVAAAHCALGSVALVADWDWEQAELAFDHALSLNAFSYVAYQRRGVLRTLQGRFAEARADLERSLELQPEHSDALVFLAHAEFCARNYERALSLLRNLPENPGKRREAMRIRATCYAMQGRFSESLKALAGAEISGMDRLAAVAWIEARRGDKDAASNTLAELNAQCNEQRAVWCDTVLAETALGRHDDAFASLEAGLRVRHWKLLMLAVDPRLAPLHEDPRWQPLVSEIRGSRNAASASLAQSADAQPR